MFCTVFAGGLVLSLPNLAIAITQFLDVPANGQQYSGLGTVHGWICAPQGELTVRFDGGDPFPLPYGMRRTDVWEAGFCTHAHVGFVIAWNWGDLADGESIPPSSMMTGCQCLSGRLPSLRLAPRSLAVRPAVAS